MFSFRYPQTLFMIALLCLGSLAACSFGDDDDDDQVTPPNDDDIADDDDIVDDDDDDVTDDDDDDDMDDPPVYATEFTLVDVTGEDSTPLQLAIKACQGLINREVGGSIYIQKDNHEKQWLPELDLTPARTISATEFLAECLAEIPSCVRYSYADQQRLMPTILTASAALGAVPVDGALEADCGEVALDLIVELEGKDTPYLATEYVFENFLDDTTGLAMLNPGYEIWRSSDLTNPELNHEANTTLVDYIFAKRLFTVFLVNGCVDPHPERDLFQSIVDAASWETPIGVYGYNNSWLIGGFLWEAQTHCLDSRNMGAIPTETGNLSFFSTRRPPILEAGELEANPPLEVEYDPEMTYVAFLIGDGDNVSFIMSTRNVWLGQRLADCEKPDNSCAPISWSMSPHLNYLAPDVLEWYFEKTRQTGNDYFLLPPSGHLYSYPSDLNEEDGNRFVEKTEEDARILGVRSTVHWEVTDAWEDAEERFLPKYAKTDGVIQGIYPINVPFMFEAFPWWPEDRFYSVLTGEDGGETVVFRPRQWRGIHNDDDPFFLSPAKMAEEIAAYPPGTVTGIYMTSDGGLNLENSFMELVKLLPPHIQLVSADAAARLALEAGGN